MDNLITRSINFINGLKISANSIFTSIKHIILPDTGAADFTGTINIVASITGGITNQQDFTITLENAEGAPLSNGSRFLISIRDADDSTIIASAEYAIGDVIGTNAPSAESNWVDDVESNITTPLTITNGMVLNFAMTDWLIASGTIETHPSRNLEMVIQASNGASSLSSEVNDTFEYNYNLFEYTTTKSGTHTNTINTTSTDFVIVLWGDDTSQVSSMGVSTPALTKSYSDSTSKTIKIYIVDGVLIRQVRMFTQSITSIGAFNGASVLQFRVTSSSLLTAPPDASMPSCVDYDFWNCDLQTCPDNVNCGIGRVRLDYNNNIVLNSTWDLDTVKDLYIQYCALTSIPANWLTDSIEDLYFRNNSIVSLPSVTLANIQRVSAEFNDLISFPLSTSTSWTDILLSANELVSVPVLNYENATNIRLDNNKIEDVSSSADFSNAITLYFSSNATLVTWTNTVENTFVTFKILNCNLPESEVDQIIAQARTSYDAVNRAIDIDLAGNSAPSSTGIADATYLNNNGCSITHS